MPRVDAVGSAAQAAGGLARAPDAPSGGSSGAGAEAAGGPTRAPGAPSGGAGACLPPEATAPFPPAAEIASYLKMAANIIATMALDLCNSSACIAISGHVFAAEPEVLAAVSVGSMLFNICLLSTSYGMASGLDTLLSQAHGAVQAAEAAGGAALASHPGRAHVRWTALLLLLVWLPLGTLCVVSGPVLRALGQPDAVADRAPPTPPCPPAVPVDDDRRGRRVRRGGAVCASDHRQRGAPARVPHRAGQDHQHRPGHVAAARRLHRRLRRPRPLPLGLLLGTRNVSFGTPPAAASSLIRCTLGVQGMDDSSESGLAASSGFAGWLVSRQTTLPLPAGGGSEL